MFTYFHYTGLEFRLEIGFEEPINRLCKRPGILRRNEQSGAALDDNLRQAAHGCGDHGTTCGVRHLNDPTLSCMPIRQHHDIRGRHPGSRLGVAHISELKVNSVCERRVCRKSPKSLLTGIGLTHHGQSKAAALWRKLREGLEQAAEELDEAIEEITAVPTYPVKFKAHREITSAADLEQLIAELKAAVEPHLASGHHVRLVQT